MFMICLEQIQLRVLLDLYAQIVQLFDGRIAGQEVQRTRSEADDLQIRKSDQAAGDGQEIVDHVRALLSSPHRIFRNIGPDIAQLQIIAGVEHTAVCVSSAAYQIVLALFCGSREHNRSVKMFGQQGLGDLRSEVSKVYAQRVASCFLDIFQRLHHMNLALNNADRALIDILCRIFFAISFYKSFSAVYRE